MPPMRLSFVAVVVMLAVSGLAGCLEDASLDDDGSVPEPIVVTDPRDYTYVDNASFSTGGHIHDYWGESNLIPIMDETLPAGAFFLANRSIAVFQPPDGRVVPQGAGSVVVTMDWQDGLPGRYAPELWVKSQADAVEWYVGSLERESPLIIPTHDDMNDLPHQLLSAWEFHFKIQPPDDGIGENWFSGQVTISVDAYRGNQSLRVYPAHPDHWGNASEILVLDESPYFGGATRTGVCFGGRCEIDGHDAIDGAIVPPDADHVLVTLDTTAAESPTRLGLRYHTAATREYVFPEPAEETDTLRTYRIPVDRDGDGPYANQTMWDLRVYIDDPTDQGLFYRGGYTITATAYKNA